MSDDLLNEISGLGGLRHAYSLERFYYRMREGCERGKIRINEVIVVKIV